MKLIKTLGNCLDNHLTLNIGLKPSLDFFLLKT